MKLVFNSGQILDEADLRQLRRFISDAINTNNFLKVTTFCGAITFQDKIKIKDISHMNSNLRIDSK